MRNWKLKVKEYPQIECYHYILEDYDIFIKRLKRNIMTMRMVLF